MWLTSPRQIFNQMWVKPVGVINLTFKQAIHGKNSLEDLQRLLVSLLMIYVTWAILLDQIKSKKFF
jgi:hypothetical protein